MAAAAIGYKDNLVLFIQFAYRGVLCRLHAVVGVGLAVIRHGVFPWHLCVIPT